LSLSALLQAQRAQIILGWQPTAGRRIIMTKNINNTNSKKSLNSNLNNTTNNTTNNTKKEETVMNNVNVTNEALEKANQIQELLNKGYSLAQAITLVGVATHNTTTKRDTIEFLKTCNDISEVRRLRKIAYAKISKSAGKADAIARYQKEIEAADRRLNELMADVYSAATPWKRAMELGMDADGAFNIFLQDYKEQVDKSAESIAKTLKLTNAAFKTEVNSMKSELVDIPEELLESAGKRVRNNDMQVVTVLKRAAFIRKHSAK